MKKLLITLVLGSLAELASAYDLTYAYQQALVYNADYLQQIASSQASLEQKNIALAKLLPQLNATTTLTENYFNQGGISAWYHQPVYSAQLSQVIFDWSVFSNYSKGKYASQIGNLQLENARQQLLVSVAQAYFDVLYAKDSLQSITMTKTALEKQMLQAKKSFEVGTVTIADVNDAQAGYDASAAQEIQATNELIYKKNIFRNLTGLDPELIQGLTKDTALVSPFPQSPDKWAQLAESNNLNIKVAEQQLAMANQDINIALSGHLPSVNLNASYQYQDTGTLDSVKGPSAAVQQIANTPGTPLSSYGVGQAGVQINLPLFAGGSVNAQVRQAKANFEGSKQQLIGVERQTDQDIRNSYWQVLNGVSLVKAQQASLKSAKTKLDSDQLGYQVGVRNSIDLVNSQKNYYQAVQTYQQSRYQYIMARIQLRYLSAGINNKFVQEINSYIQS
ncbi:MAG: hypothetical protein RLZZ293_779 [Pseudomonadota bacterium]|jgi:outer membrane protein